VLRRMPQQLAGTAALLLLLLQTVLLGLTGL
jgi:hypothetical protein